VGDATAHESITTAPLVAGKEGNTPYFSPTIVGEKVRCIDALQGSLMNSFSRTGIG